MGETAEGLDCVRYCGSWAATLSQCRVESMFERSPRTSLRVERPETVERWDVFPCTTTQGHFEKGVFRAMTEFPNGKGSQPGGLEA